MIELRPAVEDDLAAVLGLHDEAVAWLVANGRPEQWGPSPWSENPGTVELVRSRLAGGNAWIAESEGRVRGSIALNPGPPSFLPEELAEAGEPEVYIGGFVTSRAPEARGLGGQLLDHARATARGAGVRLLRLDCYAGGDGALPRYYERAGFSPVKRFAVDMFAGTYEGQLFEQRIG